MTDPSLLPDHLIAAYKGDPDLVAFVGARNNEDETLAETVLMRWPDRRRWLRALRQAAAVRAHLDAYRRALYACQMAEATGGHSLEGYRAAAWGAVLADASVWSDHPDFRPEWKP